MLHPLSITQIGFIAFGAVTLGLSMCFSFYKATTLMFRTIENETMEECYERNEEASTIQFSGFVNAIGFITYLMLLAGFGRIIINEDEEFIYIQYIEWIISTPLIVMNTAKSLSASSSMIHSLIIYDVLMIITGFCASVSSTLFWRYLFYTISSVYWVGIFQILFFQKKLISHKLKEFPDVITLFNRLMKITVTAWTIYPILFIFGPNGSILSGTTGFLEVAVCLDVMAKAAWGFIQTINSRSLKDTMEKYESKKQEISSLLSCLSIIGCIDKHTLESIQSTRIPNVQHTISNIQHSMSTIQNTMSNTQHNDLGQQIILFQKLQKEAEEKVNQPIEEMSPELQQFILFKQKCELNQPSITPPTLNKPSIHTPNTQINIIPPFLQTKQDSKQSLYTPKSSPRELLKSMNSPFTKV